MVSLSSTPPRDVLLTKRNMHQEWIFFMWYHIRPTWCGLRHNFWFENYTGTFRRQKRPWAKLWNSVQIYCYICAKALLYLHKDTDVFVQIYFYICANILLYLCRMQSIKKWVLAARPSVSSHSGKPSLLPWPMVQPSHHDLHHHPTVLSWLLLLS